MNLLRASAAIVFVFGAWVGQVQALELRDIVLLEEAQEFPAIVEFRAVFILTLFSAVETLF